MPTLSTRGVVAAALCRTPVRALAFCGVLAAVACGGTEPPSDGGSGGPSGGAQGGTRASGGTAAVGGGGSPGAAGAAGGDHAGRAGAGGTGTGGTNATGGTSAGTGAAGTPPQSGGAGGVAGSATTAGRGGAAGGGIAGSISGGGATAGGVAGGRAGMGGGAGSSDTCQSVTPIPESVRTRLELDPFYEKHVDASGLSVLGSSEPSDQSLLLACRLLENMLADRDDVRQELIRRRARFAIIGENEGTADIPEYGYRDRPQADIDYINQRARGLGGIVASCGEENILCLEGDRYYNESICVHEFSHTISTYGVYGADEGFRGALESAFESALASGILDDTYRTSNEQEYWAEGVQDWYDTNASSNPPNGVHNTVNTRAELADYDPTLYALIEGVFPAATAWGDCHAAP